MRVKSAFAALIALALSGCGGGGGGGAPAPVVQPPPPTPTGVEVTLSRAPGSSAQLFSADVQVASETATASDRTPAVIDGLAPGTHTVELGNPTAGCQAEGAAQQQVMVSMGSLTAVSFDVSCAFTPESRIVFQRLRESDEQPTIWTIRPDGSDLRQLTTEFGNFPAWSKDGTRIVFWGTRGLVWIMNWDGSEKRTLSHTFASRSAFSPGGTQVAYSTCCDDNEDDIWIINIDRTGETQLTQTVDPEQDLGLSWSPDGSMIVFERSGEIEIIDTNGSPIASLGPGASPRWSPDGSLIVFPWAAAGGTAQIWTMNLDGSNRTQLTDVAPDCGAPSYRSDGAEIVFHCPRVGDELIWRMNADGSDARQFVEIPGPRSAHPDWFTP